MEKSGKWWEARTAAGRKGSMYFFLLLSFCPFLMKFYFFFKKKKSCAFKLFTIANLTTTIYFFFPLLPPFCNGWMFSVSLKRCDFDFFFFVFKDSNFFFFFNASNPIFSSLFCDTSRHDTSCGSFSYDNYTIFSGHTICLYGVLGAASPTIQSYMARVACIL